MLSGGEVRAAGRAAIFPLGLKKGGGAEKREDGISSFDRVWIRFFFCWVPRIVVIGNILVC